jgi:hypothetical protein
MKSSSLSIGLKTCISDSGDTICKGIQSSAWNCWCLEMGLVISDPDSGYRICKGIHNIA